MKVLFDAITKWDVPVVCLTMIAFNIYIARLAYENGLVGKFLLSLFFITFFVSCLACSVYKRVSQ